ncbi:MAG: hypothetical protein LBI89_03930, partial [Prevotellaceae bacterium]|nr:hypothetical protein [Prevotellaceae bacterium]
MKKICSLFALLAGTAASAAVTVTPLATDYVYKKVTFRVAWDATPHNNKVWVWVDLCPVTGTVPATSFSTATVSSPVKESGNGTITGATDRGFFIEYASATNAGTTVTATLTNATGQFNWCAYGSDYPPNAVTNAYGGYTLKGTKPFTINGNIPVDAYTFGAGTYITGITDLTGRPDGFAATPVISSLNSPARCGAGTVTLSATASGGTTTAMTYTWTIGGTNYTSPTNSYTTGSLSSSTTYTVKVKNANNYESAAVGGNITIVANPSMPNLTQNGSKCAGTGVTFTASGGSGSYDWSGAFSGSGTTKTTSTSAGNYTAQVRSVTTASGVSCYSCYSGNVTGVVNPKATDGQAAGTCGCASGLTDCSGTCKANGTYTTDDGACTGACKRAYRQL